MTVTVGQAVAADHALKSVLRERLPIKTAYLAGRLAKALASDVTTFFERRAVAVKEHGRQVNDTDWTIEIGMPGYPAFKAEMDELLAVEVDIQARPLPWMLGDEDAKVAGADLMALEPFMEPEPETDSAKA